MSLKTDHRKFSMHSSKSTHVMAYKLGSTCEGTAGRADCGEWGISVAFTMSVLDTNAFVVKRSTHIIPSRKYVMAQRVLVEKSQNI